MGRLWSNQGLPTQSYHGMVEAPHGVDFSLLFFQDLVGRLLERKPARRLGMLSGRANDIKKHKWFEGMDWEALEARKLIPLRKPKEDSAKRLKELTVR